MAAASGTSGTAVWRATPTSTVVASTSPTDNDAIGRSSRLMSMAEVCSAAA
jgi:hypothetical protein